MGRALVKCVVCHDDDLGGKVIYNDSYLGTIAAPNLTSGKGGIGPDLSVADHIRAIRHGVGRDGEPLVYMTSRWYASLSDEDMAAVIAWVESMPAVDREIPDVEIGWGSRWLHWQGRFPDLNHAEKIDHEAVRPSKAQPGISVAYGKYLVDVSACRGCHGEDLAGHHDPAYARGAPSLAKDSIFKLYSQEDFIKAMRTGFTPGGYQINEEYMSWERIAELTDAELIAMWTYLKSLSGSDSP